MSPANWSGACTTKTPRTGRVEGAKGARNEGYPALQGQSPQMESQPWVFTPGESYPQPVPLAPSQRVEGLQMPGEGRAGLHCGSIKAVRACPTVVVGSPCASPSKAVIPQFCYSARCPTCWPQWMNRAAMRAQERLEAARVLYQKREPRHMVFSPPQKETCMKLRDKGVGALSNLYRKAYAVMRNSGLSGGVVVFHPWRCNGKGENRYRTSTRYLSPHFHVLGFGFAKKSNVVAKTGWIYKNMDDNRCSRCNTPMHTGLTECRRCGKPWTGLPPASVRIRYLLDHCGFDGTDDKAKDALRWFGEVHQLRRCKDEEKQLPNEGLIETPINCTCGAQCSDYEAPYGDDRPGSEIEASFERVRCVIYARGSCAKCREKKGLAGMCLRCNKLERDGAPSRFYSIGIDVHEPEKIRQCALDEDEVKWAVVA